MAEIKQIFQFARLLKPYRRFIVQSIFSGILMSILALPGPWITKIMIDQVYPNNDFSLLHFVLFLTLFFTLFRSFMGTLRSFFQLNLGLRMAMDVQFRFYRHLQRLSFKFHASREVGELLSRMGDANQSLNQTLGLIGSAVSDSVSLLIFPAVLIYVDWKLAIIGLLFLPFDITIFAYVNKIVRKYSQQLAEKRADVSAKNYESLSGIRTVQSLAIEDKIYQKIKRMVLETQNLQIKLSMVQQGSGLAVGTLRAVGTFLYTYYGWHQILSGNMTLGSFMAFSSYIGYLYNPIRDIVNMTQRIQETLVHTNRFFEVYNLEPDIKDKNGAIELPMLMGHIKFHNVCFSYNGNGNVLQDINLEVPPGTMAAFVGKSGVGKTTLTNLIPRFYDPTSGHITIDDHNIADLQLRFLRNQIGYVLQEPFLFHGTVKENITCGKSKVSDEEIRQAAKAAYAHDFISQLPEGYDTQIGQKGEKLSQGQRQRIVLARILLLNTPILILDEATSALDLESEFEIQKAMEAVRRNRTCIIIAHRLSTIQNADVIYVLNDGHIVEQGKHAELIQKSGAYRKLYEGMASI